MSHSAFISFLLCCFSLLHQRYWQDLVYFTTRVPDRSDTSATRTTRVRHERQECNMSETGATRVQHECDKSAIPTTRVRYECYRSNKSATRVRNFDFDNDASENIFSHPCINYMTNERLQGEQQFHSKNYLSEIPRSHAKMHLKSVTKKLNFVMSKIYTIDCSCKYSCTFPHSYT